MTEKQLRYLVDALREYCWFAGYIDMSLRSRMRSYLAGVLASEYLKYRNTVIGRHPEDCLDCQNRNMRGFPFEKFGYKFISVGEIGFNTFLRYRIPCEYSDEEDTCFSFNTVYPLFDSFKDTEFTVTDDKWGYLLSKDGNGKGGIMEQLGYGDADKERFMQEITRYLQYSPIFNMRRNEFDDILFNVCIEMPTIHGNERRTTVALKYLPGKKKVALVTLT